MHFSKTLFSIVVITIIGMSSTAFPQFIDTTIATHPPFVITGFNQSINTADWNGIAGGSWISNNYMATISENFHSVLVSGTPNSIRDEQNFNGLLRYSLLGNLSAYGTVNSNFVSDNRDIGLSSVGSTMLLGGLFFQNQSDTLWAAAGNKWDQQAGVTNTGFTYDIHGGTSLSPSSESSLSPSLTLHDEEISPRQNFDRNASISYNELFSPQDSITFFGSYRSQLRDFYFPADSVIESLYGVSNNIQDRNETRNSVGTTITMPVWTSQLNAQATYGVRQIAFTYRYRPPNDPTNNLYDTQVKLSNFDVRGQLVTGLFNDTLVVTMDHSERSEVHTVIDAPSLDAFVQAEMTNVAQLNNFGTTNTLSGQLSLNFNATSVYITGLASLFRYNTPSDLNYDDRDELTNTLAFSLTRTFSPSLQAGFGTEWDLIHLVYILSQRSANNNRNLIYKFFPFILYSSDNVNSYNRFEVLANYTVYDFEAFSEIHSFSFRQASFLDSTSVNITSKVQARFLGNLKLYDRGELYWTNFSEYPLNYFVDQSYWFSLFYTTGGMRYGVGYKYLSLTQYNYITAFQRVFSTRQTNAGPTASMSIRLSNLRLRLEGWYQVSKETLQNQIVYPNFELTAEYMM